MKRNYDKPLLHNLKLINDWKLFGCLRFEELVSKDRCLQVWYSFIRNIERRNRGQWFFRLEGDNILTKRHIHFLIGKRGLKKTYSIQNLIKSSIWDLKNRYSCVKSGTSVIQDFDYSKGGTAYVTKLSGFEAPNNKGKGLDSAENSNWKMSFNLKKRIKRINENAELIMQDTLLH